MPTQASNAKKAATRAARGADAVAAPAKPAVDAKVAAPMASVAETSIALVELSVETPDFVRRPNIVDPRRQHAIKQEKTAP
mmetsp:Transcript_24734/g.72423  ORF Transcript_24734/g.72423 Transcript_24734/m.72423 type:complete len:81 (-) Transcript_24734:1488-1730(-)